MCCRCGVPENFIFRPETTKRNDPADCQPSSEEGQECDGHVFFQTTHPAHVLLVVHTVDDATGAEEHQRFEERVCHHVEDGDYECADTAGHKHESELRNSRIREHLLDVVLRDTDRSRKDGGGCSDECHD